MKYLVFLICVIINIEVLYSQHETRNWYFGSGTDGIIFDANNNPVKVNNKARGIGYEGIVVVSDPFTGDLKFYSDGVYVINKNHIVMPNGTGLAGHYSCSQGVQSCVVPGTCAKKYYLFTNSSSDASGKGAISYSIIDFTTNALGTVTNKNTALWSGPSDQGMCLVNKTNSNDYWLIVSQYNSAAYHVFPVTASGIGAGVVYTFSVAALTYQLNYSPASQKIVRTGAAKEGTILLDFNAATGVLSNEDPLVSATSVNQPTGARFSPDGTKLYFVMDPPYFNLFQKGISASTLVLPWIDMKTCCYGHDLRLGPDGKMYHLHDYSGTMPMAVIDFPDSSAAGNACGYRTLDFTFNGEVRRFPEFLTVPAALVANRDTISVYSSLPVHIPVLANDRDPQGDPFLIDSILVPPKYGTATVSGPDVIYSSNDPCGRIDTLIYRIKDNNCSFDTSLVVIYKPLVFITGNHTVCAGDPITLSANTIAGAVYHWAGPGGFTTNQQNVVIASAQAVNEGIYLLTVQISGCPDIQLSYSVLLSRKPFPFPDLGPDHPICIESLVTLDAHNPGSAYQWDDLSRQQQRTVKAPGVFFVTVTNTEGCISSDTIALDTFPKTRVSLGNDTFICEGKIISLAPEASYYAYKWQDGSTGKLFVTPNKGSYWITVTDSNQCIATDSINVNFYARPTVTVVTPIKVCDQDTLIGPENDFVSYLWDDGSTAKKYLATGFGVYNVIVTDTHACLYKASIEVASNCPPDVYVPNAFTPNADGNNDVFLPVTRNARVQNMKIYNRWGEQVFETEYPGNGWDGKYKNLPAPADAYVYLIIAADINNRLMTLKGSVTLLR